MKVGFLGDICPTRINEKLKIDDKLVDTLRKTSLSKKLRDNQFNFGNLESPITKSNFKINKIGPHLKSELLSVEILKSYNINAVSLANNHINDFGSNGIKETIEQLKINSISYCGDFIENKNNYYVTLKHENVSIAVISCAEDEFNSSYFNANGTNSVDPINIYYQIKELKNNHDHIVVFSHGGIEHFKYPTKNTQNLYRFYIDAGATAVIGNHPHCIQGYELYNGNPIFYSLGNFYFPSTRGYNEAKKGLVVTFDFDKNKFDYDFTFTIQDTKECCVDLVSEELLFDTRSKFIELSEAIKDVTTLNNKWEDYLLTQKYSYLKKLFPTNKYFFGLIKRTGLLNSGFFKKYLIQLLNLTRCQSHRNNLLAILSDFLK